ncbi:tRNA (adenosine(37)-N6)-threonylcarbamoyltransferase complex ATPase subunit type 1 TsaE [Lentimicrobium sp.]
MSIEKTAYLHELDALAEEIIKAFPQQRIFAISGEMGAGKTTLVQALCRYLNVDDIVSSPTFSIVNEYLSPGNLPVYHFDLYRMRKPEELYDIGAEDYFFSGSYCFIEWPEMAQEYIPGDALTLTVSVHSDGRRVFTIN